MKLRDLKNSKGEPLLPAKSRSLSAPNYNAGYNQRREELAEKDIEEYVGIDTERINIILVEEFNCGTKDAYDIAQAISEAQILKSRG